MKTRTVSRSIGLFALWTGVIVGCWSHRARAQDSGFFQRSQAMREEPQLTLVTGSYLYKRPEPPKTLKLQDIVTVVVNINSRVQSEGEVESRKRANLNAVLSDWIKFHNGNLVSDQQSSGDPKVSGQWNSQFRAESELETRDSLTFTIAAKVIDIFPNGNLVIEARREVEINAEVWQLSLTGTIRREDVYTWKQSGLRRYRRPENQKT